MKGAEVGSVREEGMPAQPRPKQAIWAVLWMNCFHKALLPAHEPMKAACKVHWKLEPKYSRRRGEK